MPVEIKILVPDLDSSGPARGALALQNGLRAVGFHSEILPLRRSKLDYAVMIKDDLFSHKSFLAKIIALKKIIRINKQKHVNTLIISFCLQADFLVYFAGLRSISICSIRGDLRKNYYDDFGRLGLLLAQLHYSILSRFMVVTALNKSMYSTLLKYTNKVKLVPNFIDEASYIAQSCQLTGKFKFAFVGKLSKRKAIVETIEAFISLSKVCPDIELHVIGVGPLENSVRDLVFRYDMSDKIILYGFHKYPMKILEKCDALVLASFSEGISRAAMEALYVGKRCIMQNVDGNKELIATSAQGILIENINELEAAMRDFVLEGRQNNQVRLPSQFRQSYCISQYVEIIDQYLEI